MAAWQVIYRHPDGADEKTGFVHERRIQVGGADVKNRGRALELAHRQNERIAAAHGRPVYNLHSVERLSPPPWQRVVTHRAFGPVLVAAAAITLKLSGVL